MGTGQVGGRAILFSSCHVSCNYQNCVKNNVFNGKNTYLLRRCVARQTLNYGFRRTQFNKLHPSFSFLLHRSLVWLRYRIEEKQMIEIYVHVMSILNSKKFIMFLSLNQICFCLRFISIILLLLQQNKEWKFIKIIFLIFIHCKYKDN